MLFSVGCADTARLIARKALGNDTSCVIVTM